MTHTWLAPNGVRVESDVTRGPERGWLGTAIRCWTYAVKKYLLGVYKPS